MYSVLQNKEKIKLRTEKFPYIIIDDALPRDIYDILNKNFPKYEKIISNNEYKENYAYRYNAYQSLRDNEIQMNGKIS